MGDHRALTAKRSGAILRAEVWRFAVGIVLLCTLWVKRDAGKGTPAKALYAQKGVEVVDFVATTRRWYDRGNPRDAGGCYACQITAYCRPAFLRRAVFLFLWLKGGQNGYTRRVYARFLRQKGRYPAGQQGDRRG